MTDPREAEWAQHEAQQLAEGKCPHSGERLVDIGVDCFGRHSLACPLCDCFGFDPKDPRIKLQ